MVGQRETLTVAAARGLAVGLAAWTGMWGFRMRLPLPCVDPVIERTSLALAMGWLVMLLVIRNSGVARLAGATLAGGLCVAALLWIGSYEYSPLAAIAAGPRQMPTAFSISRGGNAITLSRPQAVVSISASAVIGVEPVLPAGLDPACRWNSSNGGAIDDPASCSVAYRPPPATTFDVLSLLIRPACELPSSVARLHLSILP